MDAIDELVARCKPHRELRAFHDFHKQHPEILDFLIEEIGNRFNSGQKSFSFASLWHYCRWKIVIGQDPGTFKMNDHLTPFYARAIVILRPSFNGWAELRHTKPNEVFGLELEPVKHPDFYARRVTWADGTALEDGWRPSVEHIVTRAAIVRPDIHSRDNAAFTRGQHGASTGQQTVF
ncbi:hypothetical protein JAO29_03900 [Edaphobacter sp. HDX4]|uniref:hypothetical protein n=1 Tax=Edaphobacter sp. HDX4 TaxID=2794064 RepID=UPI002FE69845